MEQSKPNEGNKSGVRTEQGKRTVRHNAVKHGLCSKSILSKQPDHEESLAEANLILEGLNSSFEPNDDFECHLVDLMARSQFKMKRIEWLEASTFKPDSFLVDLGGGGGATINHGQFELVLKYHGMIQGQFYRAFQTLVSYRQAAQQLSLFGKLGDK